MVHQGFLNAWKSIREKVWAILSDMMLRKAGSGRLVMCGHSLGGALATLAAPDLACLVEPQYKKNLSVITFGAPKVGTKEFKKAFDALIPASSRVVTIYDPVPKLVINDFVHVKDEVVVAAPVENPVTSHLLPQYVKALDKRRIGLGIPIVGLLTFFAVSIILQVTPPQKMAK
jgi:triacylglycerol lipase